MKEIWIVSNKTFEGKAIIELLKRNEGETGKVIITEQETWDNLESETKKFLEENKHATKTSGERIGTWGEEVVHVISAMGGRRNENNIFFNKKGNT